MGTIQVNVPSITTATPKMLTPSPALTLNRKEHKCQSPKKKTEGNWNTITNLFTCILNDSYKLLFYKTMSSFIHFKRESVPN